MSWIYTPYAGILWAVAAVSAFTTILLLNRRNKPGVNALILLMSLITEWALASGLEAASVGLAQKVFWSKVEYLGPIIVPTLFLIFTLEYSQQAAWLGRRRMILLSIVPMAALIITWTNEYHGLIWNSFTVSPGAANSIIYGHGAGYYVLIAYNYLLMFAGLLTLGNMWRRSTQPYRKQVGVLLVGSIFPFITGLIYTLGLDPFPGLDITPVSFGMTGIVLVAGVQRFQLFNLVPVARDSLIENMLDGVLVLDAQNRVMDTNPAAKKLVNSLSAEALGQPVEKVLSFWPNLMKRFSDTENIQTEVLLRQVPPCHLELHVTPLYDGHKHLTGKLIIFRDITERKQTESDLARNIEELKIINRISLIITSGLDMNHILRTLREQCSQVALIDVFYVALYDPTSSLVTIPLYYELGE